jgi:hypothetical protein
MQQEYSLMPVRFDTHAYRAVLRSTRHLGLAQAVRLRIRKWHCAIERRRREKALEDCLHRLDRRTLDDIGLTSVHLPPIDKVAAEIEIRAVRVQKDDAT